MIISKAITDSTVREAMMNRLGIKDNPDFIQGSNQSFYIIVEDDNSIQRLGEVRFVAGAVDEDMTAQEKLDVKLAQWQEKKDKAEKRKQERAEKARKDAEKRAKKKEKEQEGE